MSPVSAADKRAAAHGLQTLGRGDAQRLLRLLGRRYGGFSGPEGFARAARSLKSILNELGISWR